MFKGGHPETMSTCFAQGPEYLESRKNALATYLNLAASGRKSRRFQHLLQCTI